MSSHLSKQTLLINKLVAQKNKTSHHRMPPCRSRYTGPNTMGGVSMKGPEVGYAGSQTWRRKICSFNPFQNTFQLKENQNHNILILFSLLKLIILFIMANMRTSVSLLNYLASPLPLLGFLVHCLGSFCPLICWEIIKGKKKKSSGASSVRHFLGWESSLSQCPPILLTFPFLFYF